MTLQVFLHLGGCCHPSPGHTIALQTSKGGADIRLLKSLDVFDSV